MRNGSDPEATGRHHILGLGPRSTPEPDKKPACLVVMHGLRLGYQHPLDLRPVLIGRANTCDFQIDEESVSRQHARLDPSANGLDHTVRDLGSTNGTYVNDQPVTERLLAHGDRVQIGRTVLKYLAGGHIESVYLEEIHRLVTTDGLTNIGNRRAFDDALSRDLSRARRYDRPLSLLMVDIDHFKKVNDRYGHLAGDAVLRQLAVLLKNNLRRDDMVARYGGEEFGVILPEIDRAGAVVTADKLRRLVAIQQFQYDGVDIPLTVSVGVATRGPRDTDAQELVRRADELLYDAKTQGRNKVRS
ncbi:MAG: GGDEF domain-containing protein [Deltaproteobacteria bacterium]|nr:GGDEF domain-containing protein [Deltaproteobacteria bacterium]